MTEPIKEDPTEEKSWIEEWIRHQEAIGLDILVHGEMERGDMTTYFAERIGGAHVDVRLLPPANSDPAFWRPSDADVAALQAADLILLNGAGYAKWRHYVSLPESRTANTGRGFANTLIVVKERGTHSHGADGEHSHSGFAFTTWLDMQQARQQMTDMVVQDVVAR